MQLGYLLLEMTDQKLCEQVGSVVQTGECSVEGSIGLRNWRYLNIQSRGGYIGYKVTGLETGRW